jgi:hypothetical protein
VRSSPRLSQGRKRVPPRESPTVAGSYSVHPGVLMIERWVATLPAKTGRSVEEWLAEIESYGFAAPEHCSRWLETEHQFNAKAAAWLAGKALAPRGQQLAESSAEYLAACPAYVERLFRGRNASLRPIFDALVTLASSLGEGLRICPTHSSVSLYRQRLVADIRPSGGKRIELGLALADEPMSPRLAAAGSRGGKSRITHRVDIASPAEVDLQVRRWLKQAYERDAAT